MAEMALINLRKTYGRVVAVKDVSLDIQDGEFLVLLGPSGCGKTTTLRAIAGLEMLDRGRIVIGGRDVTQLPPGKRGIAMVFQSYAVFPHMSVYDNIVFGLRMRGMPADEQRRRAQEAADLLEIASLLDRYPAQLSGGRRQRVAVARAMVAGRAVPLAPDHPTSSTGAPREVSAPGGTGLAGALRPASGRPSAGTVMLGIRPEYIEVSMSSVPDGIPAEVIVLEPAGPNQLLTARVGREMLKVTVATDLALQPTQRVWLRMNPARIRLMDATTGRALTPSQPASSSNASRGPFRAGWYGADPMSAPDLLAQAEATLRRNHLDGYTAPSPRLYPHH